MSLEAAIGRIDQILQLRQQILDPAAAAGASPNASATASATGASATGVSAGTTAAGLSSSSFASMLAAQQSPATPEAANTLTALDPEADPGDAAATSSALGTGLSDPITSGVADPVLTSVTAAPAVPGASGLAPSAVQAMVSKADSLLGKPYVWGGGHGDFGPQPGYDCSGFVSAVLHAGGYLSAPQDTQTLPDQPGIAAGPGQYVTIYDRTDAGLGSDHVIIDLDGQFYESGGGHGAWGGGGGVERIGTPSAAYLASFNQVLHPEGL
jgi:cell wall-associated NlpC family hydrolase